MMNFLHQLVDVPLLPYLYIIRFCIRVYIHFCFLYDKFYHIMYAYLLSIDQILIIVTQ